MCYNALGKMDPKRLLPIGAQAKKRGKKNKRIWDLWEKRHKGVEKGDKAFLESLYYTKERVTMQLPMEERKVGDAGRTDGQMHGQRQLYTVGGA